MKSFETIPSSSRERSGLASVDHHLSKALTLSYMEGFRGSWMSKYYFLTSGTLLLAESVAKAVPRGQRELGLEPEIPSFF
jgi:hypothetical protein